VVGNGDGSQNPATSNILKPAVILHQSSPTISQQSNIPQLKSDEQKQKTSPPEPFEGAPSATTTEKMKDGIVRIEVVNKQGQQVFTPYGALIAIGIPLLVLLVTNIVTLGKIRIESKSAIKNQLKVKYIDGLKERLSLFYDKIIAMLHTNSEIFNTFGPKTFPNDNHAGEEAAHIWSLMVNNIILKNNKEIVNIIKTNSHLIHDDDDFKLYLQYITHAESYDAFRNTPNQLHGNFAYPVDFLPNVRKYREKTLAELQKLQKELLV
jgi:hypothetical protein